MGTKSSKVEPEEAKLAAEPTPEESSEPERAEERAARALESIALSLATLVDHFVPQSRSTTGAAGVRVKQDRPGEVASPEPSGRALKVCKARGHAMQPSEDYCQHCWRIDHPAPRRGGVPAHPRDLNASASNASEEPATGDAKPAA